MNDLTQRLKQKGWTDEDIYKAIAIIERGKQKKPKKSKFFDSLMYWLVLFVALIGNFIISIILIPFLVAMQGVSLYTIIIVIGFAFGAFFDLLIRDIEKIQNKDIIIAGIFLPLLALINVILMVNFSNNLQKAMGLTNIQHNPMIVSIVYVITFVLPYIIRVLILYSKGKKNILHNL
jgi:hypothetical protein